MDHNQEECVHERTSWWFLHLITYRLGSPAVLCWDPQMFNHAVHLFHYASLSSNFCDQMRETISFENIFELWRVYMEKIISV